jgi:primosomal protein N' (replication factor Y)
MPLDDRLAAPPRARPLYADVIVPRHITGTFTYLVPPALTPTLVIGHRVLVPFGSTIVEGAVISLSEKPPGGVKAETLKEIRSLVQGTGEREISPVLFELSRKIAERYAAPWGQCLRLIFSADPLPSGPPRRCAVTDLGRTAHEAGDCPEELRPTLERIARRTGGILYATLCKPKDRTSRQAVETLEKRSWITVTATTGSAMNGPGRGARLSGDDEKCSAARARISLDEALPDPDPQWNARIAECLRAGRAGKMALHAPWEDRVSRLVGAIQQAQAVNKSVLILAGEVAKAEWLTQRLSVLSNAPITLLHSSAGSDVRSHTQGGRAAIVVGTRSAVFTPLRSLGLIWVDGEEDPAFKEPQEPRYHARDAAWMRAEGEQALLVLASAHPSLESKIETGTESYTVPAEPTRRPAIELVDLYDEPGGTLFSGRLVTAMREALEHQRGVLLFLNRKGYAGALVCRECGGVPRCASCAVALTYYREAGRLLCRYCGAGIPVPDSCPNCRAARLNPVGEGTERVEVEARRLFPHARMARFDGDTLRRSSSARRLCEGIEEGAWDILIGTQALFQREPIPQRGLVGILQADSGLNVPDFRAAERTYHLLIDAVSVARPACEGGRVVLQTWLPDHHVVQSVVSGEPSRFYDEEMAARLLLNYPPACCLASLSTSGRERQTVETAARQWRQALEQSRDGRETVTVLGPVPTTGGRRQGHHRYQLLVKGTDRQLLCRLVYQSVRKMELEYRRGEIRFVADVDPVEMG